MKNTLLIVGMFMLFLQPLSIVAQTLNQAITPLKGDAIFYVPNSISYEYKREDGSIYYATSSKSSFELNPEDYSVELHEKKNIPCTPPAVGNLDATEIEDVGEKTLWASMPLYHPVTAFDDALCIAPNDHRCTKVENYNRTCESDMGVYAFCSQQGRKTVAICITQQQDNPELAQQIFESFKWTSPPPPSTPLKFGAILSVVTLTGIGVFRRLR